MASEVPIREMTAQELLVYRHEPYRQELLAGILHEMEPPGAEHGAVAATVHRLLANHVHDLKLGQTFAAETGFLLASDPDTVRAPDVAFVSRERVERVGLPRGYWPGAPDLAVEVLSPSDRHSAVENKALDWLDAGARAVVVVDPPRRSATVYRARRDIRVLHAGEALDLADVVPGWSPDVGDLFV